MNGSGKGLIGGFGDDGKSYAAFVSSSGSLSSIPINLTGLSIGPTAINQAGLGLVGGEFDFPFGGYSALVSPDGTVTPIVLPDEILSIWAASLNDSDVGLISGEGVVTDMMMNTLVVPYAAYIIDGSAVPISTPITTGNVFAVALNDRGNGILGGFAVPDSYVALVNPEGGYMQIDAPIGGGSIRGVAINNSEVGLIGGQDTDGNAYAAYINSSGIVIPLFSSSPFLGNFNSVAINEAGVGLVGGQNNNNLYAALVQSNGTVTSLIPDLIDGEILSVSINEEGVGLIGGQQGPNAYAALVAPNGALTTLDVSSEQIIYQVALGEISDAVVPRSFGLYLSAVYTQLAAGNALDSRFIQQNKIWAQNNRTQIAQADIQRCEVLVCNEMDLAMSRNPASQKVKTSTPYKPPVVKQNSFWIAPFGDFVYLKATGTISSYRNEIAGALVGYDRHTSNYMLGACFGYAFNYIGYSQSLGHGKVQEEMLSFYGAYYRDHFKFNSALWGGLYQFWNVRHTLSLVTSESKTHGWILDPHIEIASPWALDQNSCYFIEPFLMMDWVNSWQNRFTETGDSGFNLKVGNLYGSLLQSEVGLRFYEQFMYRWGSLRLEQKLSYINQAPFQFNSTTTSFVGSASSFPIAVASSEVQNLAALQVLATFIPWNSGYPYGGISTQATANSSYQSYFVSLYGGIEF